MSTQSNNHLPPHNAEAEKATLGALILNPRAIYNIVPVVEPSDFYGEKNRKVYEAILALHHAGESCDPVTLDERLTRFSANGVAWIDYIGELVEYTPDEEAATDYARIIAEKATRRRMISASSKIADLAHTEDGDLDQQLGEAEKVMFGARAGRDQAQRVNPQEYTSDYLDHFGTLRENDRDIAGVPTGYYDVDRLLNGLRAPHHYVIGARPGVGKSTFAIGIAEHAVSQGHAVALFSLEMSSKQIMDRRVSAYTSIDSQKIQKPWLLSDKEAAQVYTAVAELADRPLYIETQSGLTPSQIRARAMRLHAEHDLDLIIVDHLHLVRPDVPRNRKDLEIDDNVRTLTGIYKTLGVPGVTVSQLSRGVEHRSEKRPMLSDLRESGAIEEEAFVAMLLYRESYYNQENAKQPNEVEVLIVKNREGPTGFTSLYWDSKCVAFRNAAHEEIKL